MTRQEFLENVNNILPVKKQIHDITDREWKIVEKVYNFHPSIHESSGKIDIAKLYVLFGFAVIIDMLPRAELMAQKELEFATLSSSLDKLKKEMDEIRSGKEVF